MRIRNDSTHCHEDGSDPITEDERNLPFRDTSSSLEEVSPTGEQLNGIQKSVAKRTRKGHKKSRKGCFNCKKARMKCNESRPSCDYCLHRGFHCQWPGTESNEIRKPSETLVIENVLHSTTPVFTMHDFRLFSNFISSAYPQRPFGNERTWTHDIPSISSNYEYLLHSMLALSASRLATPQSSSTDLVPTAMSYRLKAITSLNTAISLGIQSFEEGNAMLATCYILFVQSILIDDGLVDYMTFIRGCVAVGKQMQSKGLKFLFHSMWGGDDDSALSPELELSPLVDTDTVNAACSSVEKLRHFCVEKTELAAYGLLLSTARKLFISSRDAFLELRKIYGLFAFAMSHEEFRNFTAPSNDVGKVLQSHFVALILIMAPISKIALRQRASACSESGDEKSTACWLGSLHQNIPENMLQFYQWPISIEREFQGRLLGWPESNI